MIIIKNIPKIHLSYLVELNRHDALGGSAEDRLQVARVVKYLYFVVAAARGKEV